MSQYRIDSAEIHTLSVEVKVLRVGGRRLTVAMYEQIPWEPVFTYNGVPLGPIWGWVNRVGECRGYLMDRPEFHRHVIWIKDSELRKSCVQFRDKDDDEAVVLTTPQIYVGV